jgi:hypothetical protein
MINKQMLLDAVKQTNKQRFANAGRRKVALAD